MLSNPDQGTAKYTPRIKYPDHLPGFENKVLPDLSEFQKHIGSLSGKEKIGFLKKVCIYEKSLYEDNVDKNIESTKLDKKIIGFTDSDISVIDNLFKQIQGDIKNNIRSKRESTLAYILAKSLHIKPSQVKYFSDVQNSFNDHFHISLIRMIAELEILGKIDELSFFNGEGCDVIYDQKGQLKESYSPPDIPLLQTPPQPGNLNFTDNISNPRYLVEKETLDPKGMSKVRRAWDTRLQKIVIVKELKEYLADNPEYVHMTELEAKTIGRLSHPNLPEIYNYVHQNGKRYMIMQEIKGKNIKENFFQFADRTELVSAVQQLGSVVDYLSEFRIDKEEKPIYHNDIKPGNLIWENGHLTLFDFAISNWADRRNEEEAEVTIAGTPAYISPERASGASQIDRRSDIYSVAATTFYLLTHQPPYLSIDNLSPFTLLEDVKSGKNRRPLPDTHELSLLGIQVSEQGNKMLQEVFNKGMNVDPKLRYNSATEFAAAFQAALEL